MGDQAPLLADRDEATGVLTLTLNRPHRKNAIDADLWRQLRTTLFDAGRDADLRAVVLTGADGDFCAGADLGGEDSLAGHPLQRMAAINDVPMLLHDLPVPTVAKVSGVAVGAGWNLALCCDLVVATPNARFSQIFARRALSLDCGGSWLLPKLVGLQQAKRLALLAEIIGAEEARTLGLVTWVVEQAEIDEYVADLARRLAAAPPRAVAQSKALLNENADRTLREALASEARAQTVNFATADVPVAIRAFLKKTEAEYTGEWAGPVAP
jgi:2-(1,2-epoxy-1,2-dihydrophenyl)acetyl-CoA isomerase